MKLLLQLPRCYSCMDNTQVIQNNPITGNDLFILLIIGIISILAITQFPEEKTLKK